MSPASVRSPATTRTSDPVTAQYENYTTGRDSQIKFHGDTRLGQTFTPGTDHTIIKLIIGMNRIGTPGTVTVAIRETDASGHPTGDDLVSATFDAGELVATPSWEWKEVAMPAVHVKADTKYAIEVRHPTGNTNNCPLIQLDTSAATYGGGNYVASTDAGATWADNLNADVMFEEHGGRDLPTVRTPDPAR
ncbi:MAG: hypothetical protein ACE5IG_07585 [Dehalococcoidia bacterium]